MAGAGPGGGGIDPPWRPTPPAEATTARRRPRVSCPPPGRPGLYPRRLGHPRFPLRRGHRRLPLPWGGAHRLLLLLHYITE